LRVWLKGQLVFFLILFRFNGLAFPLGLSHHRLHLPFGILYLQVAQLVPATGRMDNLAITVDDQGQIMEGITLGPPSATSLTSLESFAIESFSNDARLVFCCTLLVLLLF
jgi:hypothetical protein